MGWYSPAYNTAATGESLSNIYSVAERRAVGGALAGVLFAKIKRTDWQFFGAAVEQTFFISSTASVTQHTAQEQLCSSILLLFGWVLLNIWESSSYSSMQKIVILELPRGDYCP